MSLGIRLDAILKGIINTLAAHVPLVQEYTTPGTYTWSLPAHAYLVDVYAKGAGGRGADGNAVGWGGGGGGGGYEARRLFTVGDLSIGEALCVVVGESTGHSTQGYSGIGALASFGVDLSDISKALLLAHVGGSAGGGDGRGGRGHAGGGAGGQQAVSSGGLGREGYNGCGGSVFGAGGDGGASIRRGQLYIPDSSLSRQYYLDEPYGGSDGFGVGYAASPSHVSGIGYGTSLGGAAGTPRSQGGTPATGYGAGGPGGGSYRDSGAAGGGGGGADGLVLPGCPSTAAGSAAVGTNGGAGAMGCGGYVRIITYRGRVPA